MRLALAAGLCICLAAPLAHADADVPMILGHQGRLLDGNDQPVNGQLDMTFALFDTSDSTITQSLWNDTLTVTVGNGLYGVVLGDTVHGEKALDPSVFNHPALYLSVSIDGAELLPRLRVPSAPYALRAAVAAQAETVVDGSIQTSSLADQSVTTGKVADGAVTLAKLDLTDGKFVGLDADTLDGLDSSAFAPASIESKIDVIETSTNGLGDLKTELDGVKSSTDQIATLATSSAVSSLEATATAIRANTDSIPSLATSSALAEVKAETDAIAGLAKASDLSPLAKTADLSGMAKTSDLSSLAKSSDLSPLATSSEISALSAKVDQLLEMIAPTSCPGGMTLIGGAGNKGSFCIDNAPSGSGNADYNQADNACSIRGLHLCSYDEWSSACGTVSIADSWQWVAGGINGSSTGNSGEGLRPILGGNGCWNSNWAWAAFNNRSTASYRCCR